MKVDEFLIFKRIKVINLLPYFKQIFALCKAILVKKNLGC